MKKKNRGAHLDLIKSIGIRSAMTYEMGFPRTQFNSSLFNFKIGEREILYLEFFGAFLNYKHNFITNRCCLLKLSRRCKEKKGMLSNPSKSKANYTHETNVLKTKLQTDCMTRWFNPKKLIKILADV